MTFPSSTPLCLRLPLARARAALRVQRPISLRNQPAHARAPIVADFMTNVEKESERSDRDKGYFCAPLCRTRPPSKLFESCAGSRIRRVYVCALSSLCRLSLISYFSRFQRASLFLPAFICELSSLVWLYVGDLAQNCTCLTMCICSDDTFNYFFFFQMALFNIRKIQNLIGLIKSLIGLI